MANLVLRQSYGIDKKWRWRQGNGAGWIHPKDMETRHVFYTIRMIWNHSVPPQMRVGKNYRMYSGFGPEYTRDYMKSAVVHLMHELSTRKDMIDEWRQEYEEIMSYLREYDFSEVYFIAGPRAALPSPT